MKRNIYSFLMAAALCGAVSCSDKISTETPEGAGYITVTSQVGAQTKAGYETKTLPADFVMEVNQGAAAEYDYYVLMQKDVASNIYNESTGKTLAWASTDHSKVQVKAMTIPTGTSFDANKVLNISIEKNQTTNENFLKNDILGASINNGISIVKDNIVVSFRHLMSKLHVIYEVADGSMVEAIQLKNVAVKGAYSYADMDYVSNSNPEKGDITMFLNAGTQYGLFAAEAIFCPYTPASTSKPTLDVKLAGVSSAKSCEISFPANFSFEGGKRYVMKISIDANGNVSKSDISAENDWVKNVPGGKILWIGTSIPAGGGTVYSYPQMVANATGLQVINNAVGGSVVLPADPKWVSGIEAGSQSWNFLYAGGLSQSHAEAEARYANSLNGGKITSAQLTEIKALSYDSLITPYIDGTIDDCQTIIIDHGFNDIQRMILESGGFNAFVSDTDNYAWGDNYFSQLYSGDRTYAQYCEDVMALDANPQMGTIKEISYLMAMHKILKEVKSQNSNIKIIIGNYFSTNSPYVNAQLGNQFDDYKLTKVLLNYNKAIAAIAKREMGLDTDIVNVYEYIGEISDWNAFCPDGVHPSSDATGNSNKRIADVYMQELKRIFSTGTATKSSSNSYDYGWEDVEIL